MIFLMIFGGPGGRKKKFHFFKGNRMKLSGSNYRHLKTENLLFFQGSIREKLSLYRFFWIQNFFFDFFGFFWPARVPGGRHRAQEAGLDREISKSTEKQFFFGRPGSRVAGTGPGKPGIRTGIRITGPAAGYPAPGPGSRGSGTGIPC